MSDVEEPNGVWGAVVPASLLLVEENKKGLLGSSLVRHELTQ